MQREFRYVSAHRCPKTQNEVTFQDKMYSHGVCHVCGDISGSTVTHAEVFSKVVQVKRGFFTRLLSFLKEIL